MPDKSTGKLSESEKRIVLANLARFKNAEGEYPQCPLCGSREWIVGDHIVQPVVVASTVLLFNSASYPHVVVISECGYTVLLNTIVAGIQALLENEAKQPGP